MLIGIDASRAFSNNRTGTENYSYNLIRNLAKIDKKNTYRIYLRPPVDLDYIYSSFEWPNNFQFSIINFQLLWTQIGLAWECFWRPPDVLFIPAHTLPVVRRPGLKTVVTIHDLGAEYLPQYHQFPNKLYLNKSTEYAAGHATCLIAVSKATKTDLIKKMSVNAKRISVIYEGFNKDLFKPAQSDVVKHVLNKYDINKSYFIFVGTVQPRKNLARLIKAFAVTPCKIQLVIVGKRGWLADDIYGAPKRLGIEKRVRFLDYVPIDDLPALYSGAQALVLPSLFEGFGLPVLEAMACGCPVITSNVSSLPEVVGEAGILIDPLKAEEISKAMDQVLQNNQLRNRLIRQGFAQIKKFSWEKCARETLEILKSLR